VLVPPRTVAPLSKGEIEARLDASLELSERREAIARSARVAYGGEASPLAASLVSAAESSPKVARATATALVAEPERFGSLEGRAGGLLRGDDEARRRAHAELPRLAQAVEEYGAAIERERRTVLEAHAREMHRQSLGVTVSRELHAALAAPAAERERRFGVSESLREEASRLSTALQRRLSPAEQTAAHQERKGVLARGLQISPAEAKTLATVHRQVAEVASRPVPDRLREREVGRSLQRSL
jgi:hypothetical protein